MESSLRSELLQAFPSSSLQCLPKEELSVLQSSYPDVPKDFLQFLREVGAGTIGSSRLKVYGFFLSADEVFPSEAAARLRDVLLVADNFGGLCLGYEVCDDWRLVLVDPVGERVPLPVGSFTDYIRRNLLKKV